MFQLFVSSKKTNLIFLHGWGASWQVWQPVLDKLKGKYNLYAPDLPGFGSHPISTYQTLQNYTDYLIKYIKENHISKPIVIGHSFGGAVAAKSAIDHPTLFSKIVLVDSATIRHPYEPQKLTKIAIAKVFKAIFTLPLLNKLQKKARLKYYRLIGLSHSDYSSTIDNPNLRSTLNSILKEDLSPFLSKITIPTLIIWGSADNATPLADGQLTHQLISNSKFIIYQNGSHYSYLDNLKDFITQLQLFINHKS